jgi:8-oxo-dGTP pyrophosphatase MutT (NUDIX family)
MAGFEKRSEELRYEGRVISVASAKFVTPDGDEVTREIVHHPGAVSIVPVLDDEQVVLVRQYRAALERELLEIPAGKCDVAGEPVEVTANRELAEEVGLRARTLVKLVEFFNSAGFSDEHSTVFFGTDLEAVPLDLQGAEEQHMTIEHVGLDDVRGLIASGEIADAKTIIGLLLTLQHLGR